MARTLEVQADGVSPVVVRRGTGSADAADLRAVGERLAAAAHPGVVSVLSSAGNDEQWELRLAHAGRAAEVAGVLPPERVAAVAAEVAATLAALHGRGMVHGRVDASHVLLGARGRPVLCGFGSRPPEGVGPRDDVAAVGVLIVTLLGPDPEAELVPERRWTRRAAWDGWARRALLLLADHACAEPATRRPTAERLAAAIAEAGPGAVAVTPAAAAEPTPAIVESAPMVGRRRTTEAGVGVPSRRVPVLAGTVLVVLLLGVGAQRVDRPVPVAPAALAVTTIPATSVVTSTTAFAPTTTTTEPPLPPTLTHDRRRYEIGRPGDVVVLGDWDGDLVATPAVLRPETGEVFVFHSWTTAADVVVTAQVVVRDAAALVVVPVEGRDQLVVRRADGSHEVVL